MTRTSAQAVHQQCRAVDYGVRLIVAGNPARKSWERAGARFKVSPRSLYRWFRKVQGHARCNWPDILAPAYRGRMADEIAEPVWDHFRRSYLASSPPSARSAYRATSSEAAGRGWSIPSERTFQRRLNRLGARRSRYDDLED